MSKYRAKKIEADGLTFDSRKEYFRWHELSLLEKAGKITNLKRQVKYELLPSQRGFDGKVQERPVNYYADFVYEQDGETIVEDTKGVRTTDYIIKRKMMLFFYGIQISEV